MLTTPTTAIVPEGTERFEGDWRGGCAGTGPYRVVRFDLGRVELEANPHYWRPGLPRTDGLVFTFDVPQAERAAGLRDGRYTHLWQLGGPERDALRREPEFAAGYRRAPALATFYVALNCRRGPLADVELRRRFVSALDVERVVRESMPGQATFARTVIPPGLLGYEPTRPGARPAPAVEPLAAPVEIAAVSIRGYRATINPLLDQARSAGFDVRLADTPYDEYTRARDFGTADVVIGAWEADYPDADTFVYGLFHSRDGYLGRICGIEAVDAVAERARRETDPRVRHELYREAEAIVAREALLVPVFHRQEEWFARPEIEGLRLHFFFPGVLHEELSVRRSAAV